jgi:hypothetical protein
MQKGSGFLWALERRGAMQIARLLLLTGLDAPSRVSPGTGASRAAPSRRSSGMRRQRPGATLRLVLP